MIESFVENLLNRGLPRSPRARELCRELSGKRVGVSVPGFTRRVLESTGDTLRISKDAAASIDAEISGGAVSLMALAGPRPEEVLQRGDVKITGDAELADDLAARIGTGPTPLLRPVPIDMEELASILEGDPMLSGGRIDLHSGDVIPAFAAFSDGLEDADDDDDDPDRWLHVWSEGSRDGYRDMVRFAGTIDDPALEERLDRAFHGRGAFRRFRDELARIPGELARFQRFTDDRQLGRARAWLADKGYRPVPRSDR